MKINKNFEKIYSGREKNIHRLLVKRFIKEKSLNKNDINQIEFCINEPTNEFPLWSLIIYINIIDRAGCRDIYKETYFLKDCVTHNFAVTYANLMKYDIK